MLVPEAIRIEFKVIEVDHAPRLAGWLNISGD